METSLPNCYSSEKVNSSLAADLLSRAVSREGLKQHNKRLFHRGTLPSGVSWVKMKFPTSEDNEKKHIDVYFASRSKKLHFRDRALTLHLH